MKKTFSKFTHVTNAENSALLLTNHHSDSAVETYQDFQKTFSKFIHTTHTNSSTVSFCHHDSDSATESSSFSMHDNHADTSVVASAFCFHHQYRSIEFVDLIDNLDDMMKLDESSFIAAMSDHLFHDFNVKK